MDPVIPVYRLHAFDPERIGDIDAGARRFRYSTAFLGSPGAAALSKSLPLRPEAYDEPGFKPYFDGLLPEGESRKDLAAALGIPEDDYLGMLALCGRECLGDVVVGPIDGAQRHAPSYAEVGREELAGLFSNVADMAASNAAARLSLAGTQEKVGLAHDPGCGLGDGWLRPQGLSASTHILKTSRLRDVPELEYLCMAAARACGIPTAETHLLDLGRPVVASTRFDRVCTGDPRTHGVERLHQEDLTQALGMPSGSKYAELEPSSARRIAALLRAASASPARDVAALARLACFNYLVGNCDNHLKNISLLYARDGGGIRLAPAYDLVSTTYFERFSRNMGMAIGGVRGIDDVTPACFGELARELGIAERALKRICSEAAARVEPAIEAAAAGPEALASTPYVADDLIDDMQPRLAVARRYGEA